MAQQRLVQPGAVELHIGRSARASANFDWLTIRQRASQHRAGAPGVPYHQFHALWAHVNALHAQRQALDAQFLLRSPPVGISWPTVTVPFSDPQRDVL